MTPVAYTIAVAVNGRTVYLSGFYLSNTEHDVKRQVREQARREGFGGSVEERLKELNWRIVPLVPCSWLETNDPIIDTLRPVHGGPAR